MIPLGPIVTAEPSTVMVVDPALLTGRVLPPITIPVPDDWVNEKLSLGVTGGGVSVIV